ncbi:MULTISPECIES: deoxyuridine 5'-triphosphate nucleotidohydrolase [unclassified Kaistella]|uniref:deoxyuridine 5'-triphosphate nucleotidohydrolase n=1 Tax=unclassified Kaistella TaxID=2762626 RepID=UPI002732721B|nr:MULTISPECIES: deoxyuridine 5'-triphosphate nucleotidohydrolase [unclassified Kaistella]MDP2454893.1 deoxyuridine 5'-triphosphate nucleotidohydrolase [Kaistella sp. SH11-4b]MDP2456124.1 deoxyuridine 5'-triphosphate nucleotidohydrolase [Kaistella sp. SH40-3]MDP2460563.1 deoxyuridine 5'-triphosphate nucleotidohydrolase [Kaistella sp. SH19-2b]
MEYSKEFKEAISNFTSAEKDKLIIRLLKKDRILSHRLYFELIDPETADDKRNQMETLVKEEVSIAAKKFGRTKYFLPSIRRISAKITEHVKITTDKFGEVSLTMLLVSETLENLPKTSDYYKLYIYLLNKIFRSLVLTKKLDPDYYLDLRESFEAVHQQIVKNKSLEELTLHNGLFMSWIDPENIPDDIDLILKGIKAEGLLR